MACSLLFQSAVWLSLATCVDGIADLHALLPEVAAIVRFATELDGRLASLGLDGLGGALAVHATLRAVLDPVATADLDAMRASLAALERALVTIADELAALRRLKTDVEKD